MTRITLTGSGTVGDLHPGWSVTDEATPFEIGDSSGSVGSASLTADRNTDSEFVANNGFELTHDELGSFAGRVSSVDVAGGDASLSVAGYPEFLNSTVTAPPQVEFSLSQSAFGSAGSGDSQFNALGGTAVDPAGNVYVVDRLNYAVKKFTAGGTFIAKWGSFGTGDGQFGNSFYGICVDAAGFVYVTDGTRVQKFTYAGVFVTKWGTLGTGNGQFTSLTAIACDSVGNVYTADDGGIQRFTSAGAFVTRWYPTVKTVVFTEDFENPATGWTSPDGGTVTLSTAQAVSPTHSLLLTKAGSGPVTVEHEVTGILPGEAYRATASARAQSSTVSVQASLSWGNGYGDSGSATSGAWSTAGFSYSVANTARGVLQLGVLTASGQGAYFDDVTVTRQARAITGLATDSLGNVLVLDAVSVTRYSNLGALLSRWGTYGSNYGQFLDPGGITIDRNGMVYVTDTDRVQKFTASGQFVTAWGSTGAGTSNYSLPGGIAISTAGIVYVADRGNNRVRISSPVGGAAQGVLLSEVFQHYVDLAALDHPVTYSASSNPRVIYKGWRDKCWVKIKELAAANGVAFRAVGDQLEVVDAVGPLMDITNKTVPKVTPTVQGGAQQINITYQNAAGGSGVVMYYDSSVTTFDVQDLITLTKQTTNYPITLDPPTATDTLSAPAGTYYVQDSTGMHVPAETWNYYKGGISVRIGDVPGQILITLQGPAGIIPGFTGPFSLASGTGNDRVAQFSVTGTGVTTSPATLPLLTGADPATMTQEVGQSINNPFINTLTQAYDRGMWASSEATGVGVTVQFDMSAKDLAGFGLDKGSLVRYNDNQFRVTSVRYGNVSATLTAVRHLTFRDVKDELTYQMKDWNAANPTMTFAQFNAANPTMTFAQFNALYPQITNATMKARWAGYTIADTKIKTLRTS